ncbi:MAG TPA: serine protease [Planctomycetaceae bacterium]|nr:serine protease [Planctomycetaceae bacterium]
MSHPQRSNWLSCACFTIASMYLLAGYARADAPTLSRFTPPGGQLGTEIEVTIAGARLDDIHEVLVYTPGIKVSELKAASASKVTATMVIAQDCQPGLHAMRLVTKTGISNMRYFGVSPLPQITEKEPNSKFESPQPISLNTTINGVVQNEDVDYYEIQLAEGQKVTIELEGLRLGTEFFDPFVAILDRNRFEVARSDDAPLVQQDCVCSYVATDAGKYIIEVRESSFGGNDRCQYRLHVGDFPRPVSILPSGGRPGEKLVAQIVDASGQSWEQEIQLPDSPGDFAFVAERDGKFAPSPNMLRVADLPNAGEEDDSDRAKLTVHTVPVALNGCLETAGDIDWFKISARKDQRINLTVYGRKFLRSPLDSWLEVHKAKGGRISVNDDSGGPDSKIENLKIPEDGEYLIAIRDQLREGSPLHAYRIEVTPPKPSLDLTISEWQRYFSQTVTVPKGGRMAILVRALRRGFGGDLALALKDAPAGIKLKTDSIPASAQYMPVVFEAESDADINSTLSPLDAQTTATDRPTIEGGVAQRTMLVRGQNNRDMWGHDANRLAVSVGQAHPFSIELVQPTVPIVRGGTGYFTVRATRAEGHKDPIYLQPVYNPSGTSTSRSVRINADQTEVKVPITANTKAAIGEHPFVMLARSKATNAIVYSSSDYVTLPVEDSYFNFKFVKAVVEQGQGGNIIVGVTAKRPPEGEVEFEIVSLPAGVTAKQTKVKWDGKAEQVVFPVEVTSKARVAPHKTIHVKAYITRPTGVILQTAGRGELQVTAPPVQPKDKPKASKPAAKPTQTKPLSRLEQLRQAKQQAEKK